MTLPIYAKEKFYEMNMPKELFELVEGKNKDDVDEIIEILKPYIAKSASQAEILSPQGAWGSRQTKSVPKKDEIREAMGLNR